MANSGYPSNSEQCAHVVSYHRHFAHCVFGSLLHPRRSVIIAAVVSVVVERKWAATVAVVDL